MQAVEIDDVIYVITLLLLIFALISAVRGPLASVHGQADSTIDQNPNTTATSPRTTPTSTTSISFLILAVIILSVVLFIQMFNQTASIYLPEECARSPKSYDVNVTYPWKCSMFKENSLAEICAQNPQRFNLMLKDCSRFIPDEASIASLIS